MLKRILIILCFFIGASVAAQKDTSFWFAAPEITYNNGSTHSDRPILLRITTFTQSAQVTITNPAGNNFTVNTGLIPAFSNITVDLTPYINALENKPANTVLNNGLHISSTSLITAYYDESSFDNPEIFVLKGNNALGTQFVIPAQNIMDNDSTKIPAATSSFDIVATDNNTQVTITPANDIVGHAAGIPFTITLQKGQTYSAVAKGYLHQQHLGGSIISASKPIAVTIKDDSIGGAGYYACLDLAGDQIVPVDLIGTEYISIPGYLDQPATQPTDWLFITATQNNTIVRANGVVVATLQRGQQYQQPSNSQVFYIQTNFPVYVLHLSGGGCEVGHALLPQIDCTGSFETGFTRSKSSDLFLHLLVRSGGEANFLFNGKSGIISGSAFSPVGSNTAWSYARVPISLIQLPQDSAVIVSNTSHSFHMGVVELNNGRGARYGYFSDFNRLKQTLSCNKPNNTYCVGDTVILLSTVSDSNQVTWQWTGPNGFTANSKQPVIKANILSAGTYYCQATKAGCSAIMDSIAISIKPIPTSKIISLGTPCELNYVYLGCTDSANTTVSYVWQLPNGNNLNQTSISFFAVPLSATGWYIVKASTAWCSNTDSFKLTVTNKPSSQFTIRSTFCEKDSLIAFVSDSVSGNSYTWILPNGSNATGNHVIIPSIQYLTNGWIKLTSQNNQLCTSADSQQVNINRKPTIQIEAISPVCTNDSPFVIKATVNNGITGNGQFSGNAISNNGTFYPALVNSTQTIVHYQFISSQNCKSDTSFIVRVGQTPNIQLPPLYTINAGETVQLTPTIIGNVDSFFWQPDSFMMMANTFQPYVNPTENITYTITAYNQKCAASAFTTVVVEADIKIPNVFSPNLDGINDQWEIKDKYGLVYVEAMVFDRNGHIVYNDKGYKLKWDGKFNQQYVPIGTYYYIVKARIKNKLKTFTGWVLVIK